MNTNRDGSSYTDRMMARAVQIDRMNRQNSINKRLLKVNKPTGYTFSSLIQVNPQTAFLPSPPFINLTHEIQVQTPRVVSLIRTPDPPSISIVIPGNQQATIHLIAPENDGGSPILEYIIYAYSGETLINVVSTGLSLSYTMTRLINGQSYNFIVIAKNYIGVSLKSNRSDNIIPTHPPAYPPAYPPAPTLIYSLSDISAVYIYFTQQTNAYPILYYEYSLDNGSSYIALNASDNISPIKISDLTNGIWYNVSLRAVNIFGFGVSSDIIQARASSLSMGINAVMQYDPNDPNCYSGSGTDINNVSPDNTPIIGTKGSSVGFYNDSSISRKVFDFSGNDGINNIILFDELELPYILTITAWIYPREKTINTMNTLFGNTKGTIGILGLKFQYDNSGQIMRMDGASDISYKLHDSVPNIIKYNEWQHVSYVFDKYNRKICMFWNGRPVDINITSDIITSNDINMIGNFSIGGCIDGRFNMNAKLGFIKIYSYNLNAGDIYAEYMASRPDFIK
jgi:hypothetical protein